MESNSIEKDKEVHKEAISEVIQKPYTSAPKMVDISLDYENLTEISLSNPSNNTINEVSGQIKLSHPDSDKICFGTTNSNLKLPANVYAVEELLKCSNLIKESKVTMPSVEDGLSSGSEIGSPFPSLEKYENNVIKDSFSRHIANDIEELRSVINNKTFSNEYTDLNPSLSSETPTLPNSFNSSNTDGYTFEESISKSKSKYINDKKQCIEKDYSIELSNKIDSNKKNKDPSGNKAVIHVTAKEENEKTFFQFNSASNKDKKKYKITNTKKGDKFKAFCQKNIDNEALEAQHWTFPIASHTIYSSSSSDNDDDKDIKSEQIFDINNQINIISKNEVIFLPKEHNFCKSSELQISDPKLCDIENYKSKPTGEYESDEDTDKLLMKQYERNEKIEIPELKENNHLECEKKRRGKEVKVRHPEFPTTLIEGLLFRANYLGSTQLTSDNRPSKDTRMIQAQEAVGRVKAPDSESQPSVAVDLFISSEKILILNTNLSEIMMDHNLKTISYIADIGNILVLMARRISHTHQSNSENRETTNQNLNKIICHVFESDEAQLIAQSIGNAFQVAYIEFLKANGIDDPKIFKEVDYQDVLNDQEISGDELKMFANKDHHKEVIIPKQRGEALGVVIVESGWGSILPTVVLANMNPNGPAARCGSLNIGNQLIAINGHSLVGLPLLECQQLIKRCKIQTAVKVTVVNCPPVVEVYIRRPDSKYQLGFSVQNGVICSLLRGGIAERGGVRVGHHIIEINGVSVVAVSHEKIVNMLATAIGEIHIRTMPTSIFRLLTGQETPHYI